MALHRGTVKALAHLPVQLALGAIGIVWLVPTVALFVTSIMPTSIIESQGWWTLLAQPWAATIDNYVAVLTNRDLINAILVTVVVSVGNTVLLVILASLAAYAFAWLRFPGRDAIFLVVVGLLVVPLQVALIPVFSLYNSTGLFDTALGLILFHVAFGLPFGVFLLRNFFVAIPATMIEAARIDGASDIRIFLQLILPLGRPAIASLAIFQFLFTWNDLLVALTFARQTRPLTVAIFSQLREFGANVDVIAPAAFISLIVPLTVFFLLQRSFIEGILAGSVK